MLRSAVTPTVLVTAEQQTSGRLGVNECKIRLRRYGLGLGRPSDIHKSMLVPNLKEPI